MNPPRGSVPRAGNDFSTLYAPLIRDGRMEKFYWNPSREDRIGVCFGIFKDDNLTRGVRSHATCSPDPHGGFPSRDPAFLNLRAPVRARALSRLRP